MNRIIPFGLAAALLVGTAGTAISQNNDVGVDTEPTGAIGADELSYPLFIATLEAGVGTEIDLAAIGPEAAIDCVTITSLEGAPETAAGLDAALAAQQAQIEAMQGQLQADAAFMTQVQQACNLPGLEVADIVSIRMGAEGQYFVYVDDRDAIITGALGPGIGNFEAMVSGLRTGTTLDVELDALDEAATIHCVTVAPLVATADAEHALDAAIAARLDDLAELRAGIDADADLMSRLQQACPDVADISGDHVLGIQQGAQGEYFVYIDDRA